MSRLFRLGLIVPLFSFGLSGCALDFDKFLDGDAANIDATSRSDWDGGDLASGDIISGTLDVSGQPRALPDGTNRIANVYSLPLSMGDSVTILYCETPTADFDPFLIVSAPDGSFTVNDDGGGGYHSHGFTVNDDGGGGYHSHGSRIVVQASMSGIYSVYAASYSPMPSAALTVDYTLQVLSGSSTTLCPQ
jgi:hypothetical protein